MREMNVTPMLDVLLVLLVIFMATVVTGHRTLDAQLPRVCEDVCERGSSILLFVHPGPRYSINGVSVAAESLAARLRDIYAGRPEKVIGIMGSRDVTYQQVIDAMDIARGAGVRVIGLPGKELITIR
jgi:biopolymer transport protein TolR